MYTVFSNSRQLNDLCLVITSNKKNSFQISKGLRCEISLFSCLSGTQYYLKLYLKKKNKIQIYKSHIFFILSLIPLYCIFLPGLLSPTFSLTSCKSLEIVCTHIYLFIYNIYYVKSAAKNKPLLHRSSSLLLYRIIYECVLVIWVTEQRNKAYMSSCRNSSRKINMLSGKV